ncbi:MAG: formylglycine-generating enzyme family protein [Lentisphaerae bacterium]|nr:formylglycine-generating enzyme family protein [Lentisphaerota bacterium]
MEWVVGDSYASGFSGSPDDKRMAYDKKREEFIKKFRDRLSLKDLKDSSQVSLDAPAPVDNGLDELVDPQAKKLLRLAPVALNSDKLPVHRMMLAGLTIERMCPVAIVAARTVPTLYKPGVTGRVTVDLCNVEAKPVTVKLTWTVEATKAPKETGLRHEQAVSLAAGEQRTVELVDPLTTAGIAGGVGHACVEATVGAFRPSMSKARFIVSSLEGDKPGESRTFATDLGLAMQWCPPGEFLMGSENGDEDEKPVHRVRLTKGFWMGRTEVTQAQWEAVMGKEALRITNPSKFKGPDRPVERVGVAPPGGDTFWHCAVFCRKLTERERAAGRLQEGFSYRLPTEAQWEYACRAGSKEDYAGDLDAMAWYKANSGGQTHGVAQKQANAWGLYDMHGNVWEWCADGYGKYPTDLVVDPAGPGETPDKVIRGGSWRNGAAYCRSTVREKADFLYPLNSTIGFRVVLCAD